MAELRRFSDGGHFFEGPRWHDGRWWVSDFYAHEVATLSGDGMREVVLEVEGQPSGLGWMPDGSLLVSSMKDRRIIRRSPDGEVSVHADVSEHGEGWLNDMVVDSGGGLWAGYFGFDLVTMEGISEATMVRVEADGSARVAARDMRFPNASMITPDGGTLIVAETTGGRLSAFDISDDNDLTNRRVWAELAPLQPLAVENIPKLGYAPDGSTLDAEGMVWTADAVGTRCCRVAEGGEIVETIEAPEGLAFYACQLGGPDGRDLLLCAAPDFHAPNREAAREAVLFLTRAPAPHAGLP
ncbi:gluconolactonase [Thermoleophilia bacterium SCSIO 60948]|nr:gluconolactonase [Thermoleophilia bacterium SCSIO 60948]